MTTQARPFLECPRFPNCSVNSCPLDPKQSIRIPHPGDASRKCTMEKGVRVRIGENFPSSLPFQGMTSREWLAIQRMADMSPAQKEALASRGKIALAALRSASNGKNTKTP